MKRPMFVMLTMMLLCRASIAQEVPPKNIDPLGPGDHTRTLMMGEQKRTYLVHSPFLVCTAARYEKATSGLLT